MGLATIAPHSQKVQTKIYKIPKFVDPIISKIWPFENVKIYKAVYGHPDAVFRQRPDGHHTSLC